MFNLKKYRTHVLLNVDNTINLNNGFLEKNPIYINYIQNKRTKIIRDFLFLYSIFLLSLQFDIFSYKSELEFKIRQNPIYFFMLDESYDNFYI